MQPPKSTLTNLEGSPPAGGVAFQHCIVFVGCAFSTSGPRQIHYPLPDSSLDLGSQSSYLPHITCCPRLLRSSQCCCPTQHKPETSTSDGTCSKRSLRARIGPRILKAGPRLIDTVLSTLLRSRKKVYHPMACELDGSDAPEPFRVPQSTSPATYCVRSPTQFELIGSDASRAPMSLQVPSINSTLCELPTLDSDHDAHELPSSGADFGEDLILQDGNMVPSTPGPPKDIESSPKRRIVHPGLSLNTSKVSRLSHSPSKVMARSARVVEVDDDLGFDHTSAFGIEYSPETLDSSGTTSSWPSSSSVKLSFYPKSLLDFAGNLTGFQEIVPSSSPTDKSQIRDSASSQSVSGDPGKVQKTDVAALPRLSRTQHLLQELIGRLIWVHHQSTSGPGPKRERRFDVFGPTGYCAFKSGIEVLQKIYTGTLPRTADTICALVQVALQFVFYVPGQASDYLWDQMRHDLHRWSLLIEDKSSKDRFLEAMNTLLVQWQSLQRANSQAGMKPQTFQTAQYSSASYPRDLPFEFSGAPQTGPITGSIGQCNFESFLKDSVIMHICSRFLDGKHRALRS